MKRFVSWLLAEPLSQFTILGAMIFLLYSLVFSQAGTQAGSIVVTQGRIENLAAAFASARQRPPSEEELVGLIQDYIREEVLYREAMELGLDRDDTIIRRRLRQKMEFLSADMAAQTEPADAELQAYLTAHPGLFRVDPRFTFRQVYLNPQKRRATLARDIERTLAELRRDGAKADIAMRGDASLIEQHFEDLPALEVKKIFGAGFFEQLSALTSGAWHGPVSSGYGVHLVFVQRSTAGHVPPLAEVRDRVRRDWANARQAEAGEKYFQQLRERYVITIEPLRLAEIANARFERTGH